MISGTRFSFNHDEETTKPELPKNSFSAIFLPVVCWMAACSPQLAKSDSFDTYSLEKFYDVETDCETRKSDLIQLQRYGQYMLYTESNDEKIIKKFAIGYGSEKCLHIFYGNKVLSRISSLEDLLLDGPSDLSPFVINDDLEIITYSYMKENGIDDNQILVFRLDALDPDDPEYSASITSSFHDGKLIASSTTAIDSSGKYADKIVARGKNVIQH